jgi:hypothetical protein
MLQVQVLSPVLGPPCNSRAWTCRSPRAPKLENSTAEWHEKPAAGATTGPPRGQRPGHHPWSTFHAPAGLCPGRCTWGLSSAGRASAWHAEGRRFETVRLHKKGGVPVPSASRPSGTGRDGQGRRTSASPRASGRVQLCGWLPHLPGWPPETLESATRGWSRGRARLRTSSRSTSTPRVRETRPPFVPPPNVSRVTPCHAARHRAGMTGQGGGTNFLAHRARQVEHRSEDPGVLGSIPRVGTSSPDWSGRHPCRRRLQTRSCGAVGKAHLVLSQENVGSSPTRTTHRGGTPDRNARGRGQDRAPLGFGQQTRPGTPAAGRRRWHPGSPMRM